ncbi:MAG: hypothetical protein R3F43_11370 [bacterium]
MAEMIIIEYREKRLYSPRLGIYVLVRSRSPARSPTTCSCWRRRSGWWTC